VECASLPAKPRDGCGPTLRLGVVRGQDTDKDTASRTQAVQRPLVSGVFHRVRVPSVPPIHVNPRSPSGLRPGRGDLPSLRTVSRIASSWTSSHARARESSLASIFSACQRALAARTRAKGSFDLASRTRPSASPSVRHEPILDLILEKIKNRAEISVRGSRTGSSAFNFRSLVHHLPGQSSPASGGKSRSSLRLHSGTPRSSWRSPAACFQLWAHSHWAGASS
jgi:hypothetical protein